jgi:hypothetical protein
MEFFQLEHLTVLPRVTKNVRILQERISVLDFHVETNYLCSYADISVWCGQFYVVKRTIREKFRREYQGSLFKRNLRRWGVSPPSSTFSDDEFSSSGQNPGSQNDEEGRNKKSSPWSVNRWIHWLIDWNFNFFKQKLLSCWGTTGKFNDTTLVGTHSNCFVGVVRSDGEEARRKKP